MVASGSVSISRLPHARSKSLVVQSPPGYCNHSISAVIELEGEKKHDIISIRTTFPELLDLVIDTIIINCYTGPSLPYTNRSYPDNHEVHMMSGAAHFKIDIGHLGKGASQRQR